MHAEALLKDKRHNSYVLRRVRSVHPALGTKEYLTSLRGTRRGEDRAPIRVPALQELSLAPQPESQLPENWENCCGERRIRTGFRHLVGSASYGFRE